MKSFGIKEPFPKLTFSDLNLREQIEFYNGKLEANQIRIWAYKILAEGSTE